MKRRFCFGHVVASLALVACAPPPLKSVAPLADLPLPVPPLCANGTWEWSADASAVLASCDRGIEIRDGKDGFVRAQRSLLIAERGAINHDGSLVALPRPGRVELRSGNDLSLQSLLLLDAKSAVTPELAFSADGTRLAALLLPSLLVEVSVEEGRVLWRVDDAVDAGSIPALLRYVGDTIHISMDRGPSVAFAHGAPAYPRWLRQNAKVSVHRDGKRLLLYDGYSKNRLWDVETDQPLVTPAGETHARQRWYGDYVGTELYRVGIQLAGVGAAKADVVVPAAAWQDAQVTLDGAHVRGALQGELVDWTLPALSPRRLAWASPPQLELLPHGMMLETRPTELVLRRASDRRLVTNLLTTGQIVRRRFVTARGELAVVAEADGKRLLRIAGNGAERALPDVSDDVVFDPFVPRAAFAKKNSIHVIDTTTLEPLLDIPDPSDRDRFEFRSPQDQLVILHRTQKLSFIDLKTGQTTLTVPFRSRYGALRVSPNGEYIAHGGSGQVTVWSSKGVQEWSDQGLEGMAFSADSRLIHLLAEGKIVTRELATGRVVRQAALPRKSRARLAEDGILLLHEGALAARDLARGPWHVLREPTLSGVHTLGFRQGALQLFDSGGSLFDWPLGTLTTSTPIRVPSGPDARLSPDGSLLSVRSERNYGPLFDIDSGEQLPDKTIDAWSLDGSACLQADSVVPTDGRSSALQFPGAAAFAGDARSVFASPEDDLVLHDLRTPTAAPRVVARGGRLVAQSADQRTIAVTTDHGHSLSVLRAPSWQALGSSFPSNGAPVVALSADGSYLAVLSENNELQARFVTPNGAGPVSVSLTLPPAPAVSRMAFTPDERFLVLDGTPLRFVRLADGEILNAYIARGDTVERLSAPLLFVDTHGEMEGDAALAHQLFCESQPVQLAPRLETPCRLPRVRAGLVARWFAPR